METIGIIGDIQGKWNRKIETIRICGFMGITEKKVETIGYIGVLIGIMENKRETIEIIGVL